MSKFTKKTVAWHGLWWIILLMYSHVLHTSMSILNCPILPETDSSDASVSSQNYYLLLSTSLAIDLEVVCKWKHQVLWE